MFLFDPFSIKREILDEIRHSLHRLRTKRALEGRQLEPGLEIVVERKRKRLLVFDLFLGLDLRQLLLQPTGTCYQLRGGRVRERTCELGCPDLASINRHVPILCGPNAHILSATSPHSPPASLHFS